MELSETQLQNLSNEEITKFVIHWLGEDKPTDLEVNLAERLDGINDSRDTRIEELEALYMMTLKHLNSLLEDNGNE